MEIMKIIWLCLMVWAIYLLISDGPASPTNKRNKTYK